jgi:transcriptional regulator with XRE-family HTH domain
MQHENAAINHFVDNLKLLMKKGNLTQRQLADEIGITREHLWKLYRAKVKPPEYQRRYVQALVNDADLFGKGFARRLMALPPDELRRVSRIVAEISRLANDSPPVTDGLAGVDKAVADAVRALAPVAMKKVREARRSSKAASPTDNKSTPSPDAAEHRK